MAECPICKHEGSVVEELDYSDKTTFDCYKCGTYSITRSAIPILQAHDLKCGTARTAALSHAVRRSTWGATEPFTLNTMNLDRLLDTKLSNPAEAAESLIIFLASEAGDDPGKPIDLLHEEVASVIGVIDGRTVEYLLRELERRALVSRTGDSKYLLSLDGWSRFEELQRDVVDSRQAFMAMPFNNPELDEVFYERWVPAAAKAGFELVRLDSRQEAGLIDDRLRVEIRRSRFLVAELTGLNHGAYWEAGFATGLGRPVIYTCRRDCFHETHFDTKHHLTIIWEPEKLLEAAEQLTACIRETLPLEADLGTRGAD